jgi:peptidoglycan/LPS O-acetylase OafA/YrhL
MGVYAAPVLLAGLAGLWMTRGRENLGRRLSWLLAFGGGVALVLAGLAWCAHRAGIELAGYRMVLYALALILMMILRPQGLLGVREIWDRALWAPTRGSDGS